jgi:hypothetical protein
MHYSSTFRRGQTAVSFKGNIRNFFFGMAQLINDNSQINLPFRDGSDTQLFEMSDRVLYCPPNYSSTDLFARGNSGFLYRKPHGCRTVKYPPSYAFVDLRNEYNIYIRLAENRGGDRITQCFGMVERGIELEFLEGGCLTSVLKGLQYDDEDLEKRLLWASQYIEAIRYAYSKNIHCYDVSCNNFVLDGQKNVKAIDFKNTEIMGEILLTGLLQA